MGIVGCLIYKCIKLTLMQRNIFPYVITNGIIMDFCVLTYVTYPPYLPTKLAFSAYFNPRS